MWKSCECVCDESVGAGVLTRACRSIGDYASLIEYCQLLSREAALSTQS
jgi:hypothetical protein